MPDLPEGWNLKKRKRADGKLDIVGKTDAGEEYRVRTTSGPEITDTDVAEIAAVDREHTTARQFVDGVISSQKRVEAERESALESDFTALTEDIIGACTTNTRATALGQVDLPLKCGLSNSYQRGQRYWLRQLVECVDPVRRAEIQAYLLSQEN